MQLRYSGMLINYMTISPCSIAPIPIQVLLLSFKSCQTLCNPMDCSVPGFPILHYSQSLLRFMSIKLVMLYSSCPLSSPFSSCPQPFSASGSFPLSQLFVWGGQSIRTSASASFLLVNIQGWFPLGWTGWISLQSTGLSRVFSSTTVQKHQFFSIQPPFSSKH